MNNTPEKTPDDKPENVGYDNTQKWTNETDRPNDRVQTTDTGKNEGPEEKEDDNAGLRSESGKKSMAGESDNEERG